MRSKKWIFILLPLLIFIGIFSNKKAATYLFGEARWSIKKLQTITIQVPTERTIQWNEKSKFAEKLIFEERSSEKVEQDKKSGNVKVLLRQLRAKENIAEINKTIQNLKPWGKSGSAWLLNPNGGYNFALTPLTTILFLFDDQPEILYPETKKHLLHVLLINEGGNFSDAVPGTLGRIKDSENHVLMAQSAKYLKNRYLNLHGNSEEKFDNKKNGMEEAILKLLKEFSEIGFYEFNSMPYSAYSITPLLNLEAFGSEKVKQAARNVIDYLSFNYALGSYNFKYYPPFRRRLDRSKIIALSSDYQTVFMKSWLSFHPEIQYNEPLQTGKNHALMAVCLPYRPPDLAVELLSKKSAGYFVKLGHGVKSCPEIYSAGDGYLLSAGGANQGKWSIIVARPTCLFIDDDAKKISDVIHLKGKGDNFMKWNNTGVYKNFACTNGNIHIPEKFKPATKNELWAIYSINKNLQIAVHSSEELSILSVFNNMNVEVLANKIFDSNPNLNQLKTQFQFPDGSKIEYNVNAPKNKWVITAIDNKVIDRDFSKWPLLSGDLEINKRIKLQ